MLDSRIRKEKEFHDHPENMDLRRRVAGKFYSIDVAARDYYKKELLTFRNGKVLEYGCGPGSHAFFLAQHGREVIGIDISKGAIQQAREAAREASVNRPQFLVMNAENLGFDDNSFGGACGTGILHHLDIEKACKEINRTLVPGGKAVFLEPLGHNPLVNLYRAITPNLRTQDEHPLTKGDLNLIGRCFRHVECRYFYLATILAVPFRTLPGATQLVKALDATDRMLFALLPFLRRQAWVVVITVIK